MYRAHGTIYLSDLRREPPAPLASPRALRLECGRPHREEEGGVLRSPRFRRWRASDALWAIRHSSAAPRAPHQQLPSAAAGPEGRAPPVPDRHARTTRIALGARPASLRRLASWTAERRSPTDRRTCLEWEKKTGAVGVQVLCDGQLACPDPHDVNNGSTWNAGNSTANGFNPRFDGTAATVFLAQLNGSAFATHTDWRLPTVAGGDDPELESILIAPWPSCKLGHCIEPILGPTDGYYWAMSSGPPVDWTLMFVISSGTARATLPTRTGTPG